MKKREKLTTEEALAQMYEVSFKSAHDNTLKFIKVYEYKYKMLQRAVIAHEENEPLKIFKKNHKDWETKKEQLTLELEKISNKLMGEYTELERLIELS